MKTSMPNLKKISIFIQSKIVSFFLFSIFLFSCTNPPYRGRDVYGADEFVMDSYKIREGKSGIYELEGREVEPLSEDLLQEYPDVIHEGDILQVALYHPSRSDLSAAIATIGNSVGFRVTQGMITLPDLEPVKIEGLTLEEGAHEIQEKYREQIDDIQLFLSYRERTQRKVELAGLVQVSDIPVNGRIRLFEVLSQAKIPPQTNLFRSYVIREGRLLPVDLFRLIKEGDMNQNIVMKGGDKIYIADASDATVMVLGEVGQQRLVDLPNGFMSLKQAITAAGGIATTGDQSYIQVIRGNLLHPKIYTLHWRHVARLPNDSLLVMPGDIVYVAATPIAEWNRFVNQVLPTLVGIDLIAKGAKTVGITLP